MSTDESVAPVAMRKAMGVFATGVVVITTAHDGQRFGMTANSLTSVSLDPPLLLACFQTNSATAAAIEARGAFVVNFLSERQQAVSRLFAQSKTDPWDGLAPEYVDGDLPVVPKSLCWTRCDLHSSTVAGDHTVLFGRVVDAVHREGIPLVFYRGAYHKMSPDGVDAGWFW
ncbi:flavin reductase family protein [Amycolatopsis jejuensis]|uniref:flavin reductase family protein n=1 Tax=Amycolatopsis jejuensis TaxID=330084 RepID=UPI0005249A82|nr:flavin reductase family protein [Amycolatopsis jejuensis]